MLSSNQNDGNGRPKDSVVTDFMSTLRSTNVRVILLLPVALLALIAAGHLSGAFSKLSSSDIAWTVGTVIFSDLLAVVIAILISRLLIIDRLEAAFGSKLEQVERLVATCQQLKQLMKDNKAWLIDDSEVFEIESSVDEEILVIAPDLHYENQEEYLDVIVKNLINPNGPAYKYLLPEDGDTSTQRGDFLKKLRGRLSSSGITAADQVIENRFTIHLIPEESFPQSALYGLAIYLDKQGKARCLQYMPREFGKLNVEIPSDGDLGRRLIARTRSHFSRLFPRPSVSPAGAVH